LRVSSRCSSAAFVGGVGLSGGNGDRDTQCGLAALQSLQELLRDHRVQVTADIKM
jgi:hypothetical protein